PHAGKRRAQRPARRPVARLPAATPRSTSRRWRGTPSRSLDNVGQAGTIPEAVAADTLISAVPDALPRHRQPLQPPHLPCDRTTVPPNYGLLLTTFGIGSCRIYILLWCDTIEPVLPGVPIFKELLGHLK